jgi:beta-lactamase regulating signal transducer with metallopeptidase domain
MKTTLTLTVSISLFIILMLALVLPSINQQTVAAQSITAASSSLQITPTPQAEDVSVIGSTDGILIMGIVIVLIVTLPLLFHKKRK